MQYEIEDEEAKEAEEARHARRREMIEKGKRRNKRLRFIYGSIRKYGPYVAGVLVVFVLILGGMKLFSHSGEDAGKDNPDKQEISENQGEGQKGEGAQPGGNTQPGSNTQADGGNIQLDGDVPGNGSVQPDDDLQVSGAAEGTGTAAPIKEPVIHTAQMTDNTLHLSDEVNSEYAIFIDAETGDILAEKGAKTIINPASMTKILTVLVAAEHVTDLDDNFTITLNETDYSYSNDCSSVGFAAQETVTVRDLFYGTILPSGGDAAAGLAAYVAGTREDFVELMNKKLEELGLSETAHVTNCVGLYDKEHYCTVYDMAMILQAALDNELCREVLSARKYTTSSTEQHPDGILISNWFLRRIEDKDTGGEVIAGKTGFVVQSRNCSASFGRSDAGKEYICVTAGAQSSWKCIYDHVALYKKYSE